MTTQQHQKKIPLILLTRFSVRIEKFMNRVGIFNEDIRSKWLEHRINIFKSITLPSLISQSHRPDRWFLLCSEGDKKTITHHIKELEDWIVPLFLNDSKSPGRQADDYINHYLETEESAIISRIDSDDALTTDYYERILNTVTSKSVTANELVLMNRYGARWDGHNIQDIDFPNNPFVTIYFKDWRKRKISPLMNHVDILNHNHCFVDTNNTPSWLQVVHGANAANQFGNKHKNIHPIDIQRIISEFNISPHSLSAINEMRIFSENHIKPLHP